MENSWMNINKDWIANKSNRSSLMKIKPFNCDRNRLNARVCVWDWIETRDEIIFLTIFDWDATSLRGTSMWLLCFEFFEIPNRMERTTVCFSASTLNSTMEWEAPCLNLQNTRKFCSSNWSFACRLDENFSRWIPSLWPLSVFDISIEWFLHGPTRRLGKFQKTCQVECHSRVFSMNGNG